MHISKTDFKNLFDILFEKSGKTILDDSFNLKKYEKICINGRLESHLLKFCKERDISISSENSKKLRAISAKRELHSLVTFNGGKLIERIFFKNGLNFTFLKGVWLNNDVYSDLSSRPIRDIDLLIDSNDLKLAICLLSEVGFFQKKDSLTVEDILETKKYFTPSFVNSDGVIVDLHLRATMSKHYLNCPITNLLLTSKANNNVEAHLMHLIYHSTIQDNLSNGPIVMRDIVEIITKKEVNFHKLEALAKEIGLYKFLCAYIMILERYGLIKGPSLPKNYKLFKEDFLHEFLMLNFYNNTDKFFIDLISNFFTTLSDSFSKRSISHQSMKSLKKLTIQDYVKRYLYLLRKYLANFVGIIVNPYKVHRHIKAVRVINILVRHD